MGVAMNGSLVLVTDEVEATEAQGKRHFVKSNRWEVLSDPDGYLKGTWLPASHAKEMLSDGDFYVEGTVIKIWPAGWVVKVHEGKLIDCQSGVEVEP